MPARSKKEARPEPGDPRAKVEAKPKPGGPGKVTMDYLIAPGAALTPAERRWIKATCESLAADKPGLVMVHIGVERGASLHCSRAGAPKGRLIGVDLDTSKLIGDSKVELIEGDSALAWRGFELPIDFLFIDADHREKVVLADAVNWRKLVAAGGVIAFHDYGNDHLSWCKGVKRAVDALLWTGWEDLGTVDSIRAFRRLDAKTG